MNYGISRNGGKMDIKSFYTNEELATQIRADGTDLNGLPVARLFTIEELATRVEEMNGTDQCVSVLNQINESVQDNEEDYTKLHIAYWTNFAKAYLNVKVAEQQSGLRLS